MPSSGTAQHDTSKTTPPTPPIRKEFVKPNCVVHCTACTDEWACLGQRLTKWSDDFYAAIIAVGTLGAGFTFSVIFSELPNKDMTVNTDRVRSLLILAWILFILAIAVAAVSSSVLRFSSKQAIKRINDFDTLTAVLAALISITLQGLILAAFVVSALAMRHYDHRFGQAAFVVPIVVAGLLGLGWGGWSMSVMSLFGEVYIEAN